jgi:hypothetical protein
VCVEPFVNPGGEGELAIFRVDEHVALLVGFDRAGAGVGGGFGGVGAVGGDAAVGVAEPDPPTVAAFSAQAMLVSCLLWIGWSGCRADEPEPAS